jgi:hypothetical protein
MPYRLMSGAYESCTHRTTSPRSWVAMPTTHVMKIELDSRWTLEESNLW